MSIPNIVVVGLGYFGLPLAMALARHAPVTGYDHDITRIRELRDGHDRTGEISREVLAESVMTLTTESSALVGHDVRIITVPTPVDRQTSRPFGGGIGLSDGRQDHVGRGDRGPGKHRLSGPHRGGSGAASRQRLRAPLRGRLLHQLFARADQSGGPAAHHRSG
jgi:UDP-glucose/GDP-mannose dehydrogenase family, NAD binding domain